MAEGDTPKTVEKPKEDIKLADLGFCAYAGYYFILFFAFWFGAARFDVDGDGDFDPSDVQAYLSNKGSISNNNKRTPRTAQAKAKAAPAPKAVVAVVSGVEAGASAIDKWDKDGDGDVDLHDLLGAQVEGSVAQEDEAINNLMVKHIPPYFIIFECTAVLLAWIIGAAIYKGKHNTNFLSTKGGMDTISDHMFDLRWSNSECEDLRPQIWRWLCYQFTHVGLSHVAMNVLLNNMLGIPLEGFHGWWRLAIMYNVGVFGGAMCYYLTDAHATVVGCSGGCYALIGIHFADLIMNWSQKKFRFPTITLLFLLVTLDIVNVVFTQDKGTSHAAHVGGCLAGLIIGVIFCKSMKVKAYKKFIAIGLAILGAGLIIFALVWIGVNNGGPLNIFEAGNDPYCATFQFYDPAIVVVNPPKMVCVACGNAVCMDTLMSKTAACCETSSEGCTCIKAKVTTPEACDSAGHRVAWSSIK